MWCPSFGPHSGLRPVPVQQGRRLIRRDRLMEIIVHHADRSESARGKAFRKLDRELAVLAHRDRVVVVRVGTIDVRVFAELLHQLGTARHGAGKRPADPDVILPGSGLPEAGIKRHHFGHLNALKSELLRHPGNRFLLDVSEMMLQQVQNRQHGTALRHRVMRDGFVDSGKQLGRNGHGTG